VESSTGMMGRLYLGRTMIDEESGGDVKGMKEASSIHYGYSLTGKLEPSKL